MYVEARVAVELVLAGLADLSPIQRQCALAELDAVARSSREDREGPGVEAWTAKYLRSAPTAQSVND